jgi:copper resistance protein C
MLRNLRRLCLIGAFIVAGPAHGLAHAFLDHATPAIGSTVAAAPAAVKLWFTQAIEPAFSGINVTDEAGHEMTQGKAARDAADPRLLTIAVEKLAPGTYKVTWHVTSVDTHKTEGNFEFTVVAG